MKIAFLSFYSGKVNRGVETFVHEVANRLSINNEVVVIQSGPVLPGTKYNVIQVPVTINLSKKNWYIPYINYYSRKNMEFTLKAIKFLPNDLDILFPTNGQWQSLICKIMTLGKKIKTVIAGQSGPGLDDRLNLLAFPDTFIGLTEYQVRWAKKANPFVKVKKIPNGVDINKFTKKGIMMGESLPKPIILCVSAFDFWKRNNLIIKAVSKLGKGSLLLVGKGEEENKLTEMGNKLLPGRFKIISFPHEKMPEVYRSADLFTFATVPWESFGIVMVEAMASGLPVVVSDDPIRREIVGDAGLFVNPQNSDEYAKALENALQTDWKDKPRKQAEKFSWDRIAQEYEKLFSSLITNTN